MWNDDDLEPLAPLKVAGMSGLSLLEAWFETELLLSGRGPVIPGKRGEPRAVDRRIHDFVEREMGNFTRRRIPASFRIGHSTMVKLARWYCTDPASPFRWCDMPAEEQAARHHLNVCSALCELEGAMAPCRRFSLEERAVRALLDHLESAADARMEL